MDYIKELIHRKRNRRKWHYMSDTELFLFLLGYMVVFLLMMGLIYILKAGPV